MSLSVRVRLDAVCPIYFIVGCICALLPGCRKPAGTASQPGGPVKLLVASYDPTREMYTKFNPAFVAYWKGQTGEDVAVTMAHGPSGTQAAKIIDGLEADVAALSVDFDIDQIALKGNLLPKDWRTRLPYNSSPYTSAVVFLIHKGNPKNVKDWPDLARPGLKLAAPNPKSGGGARWIYLAAWGSVTTSGGDEAAAREFTGKVYRQTQLDPAMRGSTQRFLKEEYDVLFGWESEILQLMADPKTPENREKYEVVVPSSSITIEVPVAVVEKVADKKGTRKAAEAFVHYLFSDEGQEIAARHFNRPQKPEIQAKYAAQYPQLKRYALKDTFGDWDAVMKKFFANGAIFDQQMEAR